MKKWLGLLGLLVLIVGIAVNFMPGKDNTPVLGANNPTDTNTSETVKPEVSTPAQNDGSKHESIDMPEPSTPDNGNTQTPSTPVKEQWEIHKDAIINGNIEVVLGENSNIFKGTEIFTAFNVEGTSVALITSKDKTTYTLLSNIKNELSFGGFKIIDLSGNETMMQAFDSNGIAIIGIVNVKLKPYNTFTSWQEFLGY